MSVCLIDNEHACVSVHPAKLYNHIKNNPETHRLHFRDFSWYSDRGSNPGPLPCEGSTLTN